MLELAFMVILQTPTLGWIRFQLMSIFNRYDFERVDAERAIKIE